MKFSQKDGKTFSVLIGGTDSFRKLLGIAFDLSILISYANVLKLHDNGKPGRLLKL